MGKMKSVLNLNCPDYNTYDFNLKDYMSGNDYRISCLDAIYV